LLPLPVIPKECRLLPLPVTPMEFPMAATARRMVPRQMEQELKQRGSLSVV
jgi:hypothetical protein